MSPMEASVQEALADLQTPGMSVEFTGEDGSGVKFEDPREVVLSLCEIAKKGDPATDPWPSEAGEPVEFVRSLNAEEIGAGLIDDLVRFAHLRTFRIHYVFRNKDNWASKGRTVLGQMQRPTGLLKEYASADFIVLLNWKVWGAMNPMQRVALVYHELSHGDAEGKVRGHDFEGFFHELSLFGTKTYRDWNALAQAVETGVRVKHQFSLGLELATEDEGDRGPAFPDRED